MKLFEEVLRQERQDGILGRPDVIVGIRPENTNNYDLTIKILK